MARVIIIGAGASGIAAATRLLEKGFNDIIILEAENRIGGRIHSVDFGGSIVDIGGQWCHGEQGNIVYQMVKDLDLLSPSHNNYQDNTYYLSNGTQVNKTLTDPLFRIAQDVMNDEETAKNYEGTFGHYFMTEYMKRVLVEFPYNEQVLEMAMLMQEWFHKFFLCLDSPKSWFDVSTRGPFNFRQCEGDPQLQWRNKGYKTILDVLMRKFPDPAKQLPIDDKIFFNKEVNRVIWDGNSVSGVTVECADGSSYNARHVIVTVSLGVLKNLYKNFEPKLPQFKLNAIKAMSIGTVNKILLKFPEKWWPDYVKGFSFLWSEEDKDALRSSDCYRLSCQHGTDAPSTDARCWLEDVFGFYVIDSHPRVLLGWVVGPTAGALEKEPDDVITKGCMMLLRKFVGSKFTIPEPDGILRSKWQSNPHFNGSYTHMSLEAEKRNVSAADLERPVINSTSDQCLLFAGEATHPYFYSTVHGAIETGYREADRILNIYA